VLGLPFGVEGIFFFLEAIFAGIYLWGWRRLAGWAHWWSGVPIAVSGILGAMAVIAVNAWMNTPGGFTQRNGRIASVDVWQVFFSRSASYEMPHMILAAYMVAGFGVASVYAAGILRGRRDRYHYTGFALGFIPAAIITPFQIFVGDTAARAIAHDQPVKFAAMEYVTKTSRQVPEWLGGVYVNGHIYGGIKIPYMDSLLVGFGPGTKVIGWDSVPPADRPPVVWLIHLTFDVMVGLGSLLLLAGLWAAWTWWRRRRWPRPMLFWALGGGQRAGCDRGHGVRLGGHRGGPPAVGGVRAADHHPGSYDQRRRPRQPEHRHRGVRGDRRGHDRDLADVVPPLAPRRP
jgi:cytochrome d ubiquinol oxidase subunit I